MSKPVGPYSPFAKAGGWMICSGQVGLRDGALVEGGIEAETRQAMANLRSLLESQGVGLADVVKTLVFLVDMADFAAMNAVYAEAFGDHRPARSTVGVAGLPLGARMEVEAWAWIG